MNTILSLYHLSLLSAAGTYLLRKEPPFHLDLDRSEPWSSSSSSSRPSPFLPEVAGRGSRSHNSTPERRASPFTGFAEQHVELSNMCSSIEDDMGGIHQKPMGERVSDDLSSSPHQGLPKYLSRFEDAMKLRGQLANEKPAQDGASASELFDPFRIFRLIGSVLLAVFVRLFVCKYLVSLLAIDAMLLS